MAREEGLVLSFSTLGTVQKMHAVPSFRGMHHPALTRQTIVVQATGALRGGCPGSLQHAAEIHVTLPSLA